MVSEMMSMIKQGVYSIVELQGCNRDGKRGRDRLNPLQCPSIRTLVTLDWKGAEVVTAVFPSLNG